jgi:hypothetical protein
MILAAPRCHLLQAHSGENPVVDDESTALSSPRVCSFVLSAVAGDVRASEILMGPSMAHVMWTSPVAAASTRMLRVIVTKPGPSHGS